ncbi:MAG: hypothetical protein NUV47_02330 [Patescibacteria group bacterium]|nr:hypothetical protein [Patescibacteria group bacterium]
MILQTWSNVLLQSFREIWFGVASFVPNLVIAIIIFIVGWAVGSLVGRIISQVIHSIKLDQMLKSAGVEDLVKRAGHNLDSGKFVGTLVEWFVIVAFLIASFDVLGLTDVNLFLQDVLAYLPRVIVAVLILLVAVVIADVMQKVVAAASRAAGIHSAGFLGTVTKWSILIFAILTALVQLNIAVGFINTLFTGVIVAISLAFGLAFGLGGQDAASKTIDRIRSEISHKG